MMRWAFIFAILALLLGPLGFDGIAGAFAAFDKLLFFLAITIVVILLVPGLWRARASGTLSIN